MVLGISGENIACFLVAQWSWDGPMLPAAGSLSGTERAPPSLLDAPTMLLHGLDEMLVRYVSCCFTTCLNTLARWARQARLELSLPLGHSTRITVDHSRGNRADSQQKVCQTGSLPEFCKYALDYCLECNRPSSQTADPHLLSKAYN